MEFMLENISCLKFIPDNMKHLIIYCHGILSSKNSISTIALELMKNNIGVISFNFPAHQNDDDFSLTNCINYLDKVNLYATKNYNVKISVLGSSFGGYVILNKINKDNPYYKVLLKYPAVNFMNDLKRKTGLNDSYFSNLDKIELKGFILTKDAYFELKDNNVFNNFNKIKNNISVIHGDSDATVYLSEVEEFCSKYDIPLTVVKNGHHGLLEFDSEVVKFIMDSIGE